jgi:hypothetical protein
MPDICTSRLGTIWLGQVRLDQIWLGRVKVGKKMPSTFWRLTYIYIYIYFLKFASPEGRIYFRQSIQYSLKVGKYCRISSSPERVGIYFSGLQFHPWIDLLPQEKSPTAGLELTTFRSICHMQICDSFCIAAASVNRFFEVACYTRVQTPSSRSLGCPFSLGYPSGTEQTPSKPCLPWLGLQPHATVADSTYIHILDFDKKRINSSTEFVN